MSITAHTINAKGICIRCGLNTGILNAGIVNAQRHGAYTVWQHGDLSSNGYITVHVPMNKTVTDCKAMPTANQVLFDIWLKLQDAEFEKGATKLNIIQCEDMLKDIRRDINDFLNDEEDWD